MKKILHSVKFYTAQWILTMNQRLGYSVSAWKEPITSRQHAHIHMLVYSCTPNNRVINYSVKKNRILSHHIVFTGRKAAGQMEPTFPSFVSALKCTTHLWI